MLAIIYQYTALLAILAGSFLITSPAVAQSEFVRVEHGGNIICGVRADDTIECTSAIVIDARTPPDFPPVSDISVGPGIVCTVLTDGELNCFGSDGFGLDNPPSAGAPYSAVAVGQAHACAINNESAIECFGLDSNNRLDAPTGQFTQLSLSQQQGCAVNVAGGVECWGANDQGTSTVPDDLPPATKVVAGFATSCALLTDGSIECWGRSLNSSTSINTFEGPFVDFDLIARNSRETGQSGLCAIDEAGNTDCTFVMFNPNFSATQVDLDAPVGLGNRDVSFNSFNLFASGCYVTSAGEIDCFGPSASTEPPSLIPMPTVPTVTGLQGLVYASSFIELVWNAPSTGAFNVSGHEIQRNGEVTVFTPNANSFLFDDLVPGEPETFAVRKVDIDGNVGEFSETITIDTANGLTVLPPVSPAFTPPDRLFEPNFLDAFVFCSDDLAELLWFGEGEIDDEIDGYEIRRDGEFIGFTEDEFFDDLNISDGVVHNYDVIAIDLDDPTRFHGVASATLEILDDPEICDI